MNDLLGYLIIITEGLRNLIDPIMVLGVIVRLTLLFLAFRFAQFELGRLDSRLGLEWKKVVDGFESNPVAAAIYLGLRYFGTIVACAICVT